MTSKKLPPPSSSTLPAAAHNRASELSVECKTRDSNTRVVDVDAPCYQVQRLQLDALEQCRPGMSASKPNFFSDGLKRAQSGLRGARTPTRSAEDDAILARAVTAGAYAGAVAGASAAAATVRAHQSQSAASLPARADSGQREWQRTWDEHTKAFYYWSQSTRETTWTPPPEWATPGPGAGGLAAELAQTLERTFAQAADLAEPLGHSTPLQTRTQDGPSLYARDTDIDTKEEVRA